MTEFRTHSKTYPSNLPANLSVGVPVLLALVWHMQNRGYPRYDEGDYFTMAQTIYYAFKNQGIADGVSNLYFARLDKSNIVHFYALPYLFAFGGNVLLSSAAAALSLCALFAIYVSKISSLLFENRWVAALWAILISTIPWELCNAHGLNSEIAFAMSSAMLVYFLIRCDSFQDRGHSVKFGAAFALCVCTRPVETMQLFFLPLLAMFWVSRTKIRSSHTKLGFSSPFSRAFAIAFLIPVAWFLPSIASLYSWAYRSSFGQWAHYAGHRGDVGFFSFQTQALLTLYGIPFFLLLCLAWLNRKNAGISKKAKLVLGALFASMALQHVVGGSSYSFDLRYYYVGALMATGLMAFFALSGHERRKRRFALGAVAALVAVQVLYNLAMDFDVFDDAHSYDFHNHTFSRLRLMPGWWPRWSISPQYPDRGKEPLVSLLEELSRKIPQNSASIDFLRLEIEKTDSDWKWGLNPWALVVAQKEMGIHWSFAMAPVHHPTFEQRYDYVSKNFHYIVVGPVGDKSDPGMVDHMHMGGFFEKKYVMDKLRWNDAKLDADGLEVMTQFNLRNFDGNTGTFILIRNKKKPL